LYPYVRFATCASLIAFIGVVGVGALVLLPRAVERPLVVSAETPDSTALPCNLDPSCLSRRAVPAVVERGSVGREVVERGASAAGPLDIPPAAENAPERPSAETERTATAATEPEPANELTAPAQATPMQPPAVEETHVARPAIKAKARLPALKKTARRDRVAKRHTNEALNSVRRFGDNLHDIPASAYAADGTRRRIVIRPTSIQDVYYYSVPR
jgi:hypothetical protein